MLQCHCENILHKYNGKKQYENTMVKDIAKTQR